MLALQKLWTVLAGACGGALLARVTLDWLLGLDGDRLAVAIVAAAVLGAFLSIGDARQITPMDPSGRRDAILGWGGLIGGVASVACLFAPMPWGAFAAAAMLAATVIVLRRVPPAPPQATS